MPNQWKAFADDNEVEIPKTTSNPTRKIKKKIRRKEEKYEKNSSPELYNEILQLKKQLKELTTEPVKKTKKKKFKKKRIDKAQKAKERKRKREKEFAEKSANSIQPNPPTLGNNHMHIQLEFQEKKDLIQKTFLSKLGKLFPYPTYVPRPILLYFSEWWDCEKMYSIKTPEEYSLVGLRNIQNTIYTSLPKLPMDMIKIIWKFYYNPNYLKAGIMIEKFKKKIDKEKDIYNMRMKLYS
tara:strand:- start:797 stop:1510 length:714 start_codon:yes stop_codon:yes gene_type:complete